MGAFVANERAVAPVGIIGAMDLSFRHDGWLARLPRSPRDAGRVERIVVRPGPGERQELAAVDVLVDGLAGDRRSAGTDAPDGTQVSLMNVHVLRACARGDDERMRLAGDNFIVDLDLSEAALPTGTRLQVGAAVLEVSAVPHRPCASFHARFGRRAAQRVARGTRTGRRTRGVLCRVLVPGRVECGDAIRVERG